VVGVDKGRNWRGSVYLHGSDLFPAAGSGENSISSDLANSGQRPCPIHESAPDSVPARIWASSAIEEAESNPWRSRHA